MIPKQLNNRKATVFLPQLSPQLENYTILCNSFQFPPSLSLSLSLTMPMPFFFLLLLLFLLSSYIPVLLSSTLIPIHNRRTLHEPFFPQPASPPAQPPSPSFPKYPFSSNPQPFFPNTPSAPPPPTTPTTSSSPSLPTFPANITSLIYPNSRSAPHHSSAKLVPAIVLPLLAVGLLALTFAFFFNRRSRRQHSTEKASRSDSHRLFPANSTLSDGQKLSASSAPASSEFLYLGTLVNSRSGHISEDIAAPPAIGSPYRKLGSPELRPLPPLSRHFRQNYSKAEGDCSSEEEFYSPRGSSADKESLAIRGRVSSSGRNFPAAMLEKCGSRSSNLSTPSYPSSNSVSSPTPSSPPVSSPAIGSSPARSTAKSLNSRSNRALFRDIGVRPPPPPPPPPPTLRPLTPSPPKRKPPSPSPSSSPHEKDSDMKSRIAGFTGQDLRSPARSEVFSRNTSTADPPQRQAPPPPPPPPPVGYWESQIRKPPVLIPPKSIGMACTAAIFPAKLLQHSDAIEKNEETPRPKLKPLHWDKVRASSDRAMVWDQLKSSSFQ